MKLLILLLVVGGYVLLCSKRLRIKLRSALASVFGKVSLQSFVDKIKCKNGQHIWVKEKDCPGVMSYSDRLTGKETSKEKAVCVIEKCSRCGERRGYVDTGTKKTTYSVDYLESVLFSEYEKQRQKNSSTGQGISGNRV